MNDGMLGMIDLFKLKKKTESGKASSMFQKWKGLGPK